MDLRLVHGTEGCDLSIKNGDIDLEQGLQTAALISLYCDREVDASELEHGDKSIKGWWGDSTLENEGDKIGSKLWLLSRSKRTRRSLKSAERYASDALAWMIEDGVAKSIACTAEFSDELDALVLQIEITKPNEKRERFRFALNWDAEVINAV